jgi:putative intracellular protease/amidase
MVILMPLPRRDVDPSEAALSWQLLRAAGHGFVFATPDGNAAAAEPVMLSGIGLDLWSRVPRLQRVIALGALLRASRAARQAWRDLAADPAFRAPLSYAQLRAEHFEALLLPGGHAAGIREYLENETLQRVVAQFFDAGKPVAAICHGVVLAARSRSSRGGRSVLHGRRTTALTWSLERAAWRLMRWIGRRWDPDYYRTYREAPGEPEGWRSVQSEVTRALAKPEDFLDVPRAARERWRKTCGLLRDTPDDARPAFVVRDGNYVSARWPGDLHAFARTFAEVLGGGS